MLAEPLVLTVYGSRWGSAVPLAGIFAVMAPFLLVWAVSTPLLWNTGRKSVEFKVQLPFIAVAALGLHAAAQHSLVAVGWVAAALFAARTMLMVVIVARVLGIGVRKLMVCALPAVGVVLVVLSAVLAGESVLQGLHVSIAARLALGLLLIVATMAACVLAVPTMLPGSLRRAIARLPAQRLPIAAAVKRRLADRSEA